ncbi:hypothetical protein [Allochromatium palmeri]|uniref:Uncharacterized protein n=1 Tax=Allochromatium palmeri TaxID=231048 RepID=A0A6N8E8L6_9GAMM|nr:hypothetical protein [Allochromatium palmeri]MTW20475.1 hypothetical protein [Allochromatium palmeri]
MGFYIKRYLAAFQEHRHWTFMALVPVILYLIVAALRVDSFAITQDFSYSGDVRLAAATRPVDTLTLEAVLADPDQLFLDTLALSQLQQRFELQQDARAIPTSQGLRRLVHDSMNLSSPSDSRLRLAYEGPHAHLGAIMVHFYSEQLLQRVEDGAARHQTPESRVTYRFALDGTPTTIGMASPWNAERLPRAILVFALSLLAVLLLIGILELSDPSFKSERQIARYLDLPVLGSIPDATQLARHLKET